MNNDWISVKDKLPTVSDGNYWGTVSANVLVFRECGTICVAYLVEDEDTKELSWYTSDSEGWYLEDVTHWMPLPKPQKEIDMGDTAWVLTEEYNQYDQYGEYFCAVFKDKPTLEQLINIGVTEDYAAHCIESGGGRLYGGRVYENSWWYLREVEFNKQYSED